MNKLLWVTVIVALTLGFAGQASAQAPVCNQLDVLADWIWHEYNQAAERPRVVIAFDHRREVWSGFDVEWGVGRVLLEPRAEFKPAKARINLASGEGYLLAVVYDTDPLLYTVTNGAVTEENVENLEALQQFVSAFSGFLHATAQSISVFDQARLVSGSQLPTGNNLRRAHGLSSVSASMPESTFQYITEAAERGRRVLVGALENRIDHLPKSQLSDLGEATQDGKTTVDSLASASSSVLAVVQAAELDTMTLPSTPTIPSLESVDSAFKTIETARLALETKVSSLSCTAGYGDLARVLALSLEPTADYELPERRKEQASLLKRLEDLGQLQNQGCTITEANAFVEVSRFLATLRPGEAPVPDILRAPWLELRQQGAAYASFVTKVKEAADKARELATKRDDATQAVARLQGFARRYNQHLLGGDVCSLRRGVLPVPGSHERPNVTKVRTTEFEIKTDGFAADRIEKTHSADLTTSFQVGARGFLDWSVGFGLIYTDTAAPAYTAVTNPLDMMEDGGNMMAEGDPAEVPLKVIRRTDETSLAGKPTILLSLHPTELGERFRGLSFDLGAALDDENPAGLIGLSYQLSSIARFGAGAMYYRYGRLGNGQTELLVRDGKVVPESVTLVAGNEDIVLRDKWDWGMYYSLVISIDGLNFFGPKEKKED